MPRLGDIGPIGSDFPRCVHCGPVAAGSTEDGAPICWRCTITDPSERPAPDPADDAA